MKTLYKLVLTGVQASSGGNYSVEVTSPSGSTTSDNAMLTVYEPVCAFPPGGLAGWWRGEYNALDSVGDNPGTPVGNVTYAVGRVGQAFSLDGAGSHVSIPSSSSVNFSLYMPMSIETWVYRTGSASIMHIVGKRNGCTYGGMVSNSV